MDVSPHRLAVKPTPITSGQTRRVAVSPPGALAARSRLFAELSATLPVTFEGREPQDALDADAEVVFATANRPRVSRSGRPSLALHESGDVGSAGEARVGFAGSQLLDRRLRSAVLGEASDVGLSRLEVDVEDTVLAQVREAPVWVSRASAGGRTDTMAVAPPELRDGEHLRDRLKPGRFLALLPLIHFLREVVAGVGWNPPPLRATYIFDDPNLNWTSYGYLDYGELARHARSHGYHVAIAMVPIDGRVVHPGAVRTFRDNAAALSIVVHGNDHVARELARQRSPAECASLLSQALRRIEAFERRSGLAVGRVMVPPHGACSDALLRAMLPLDFEAACLNGPPPWAPASAFGDAQPGLDPVELVAGGVPILPRIPIGDADEEIVLRGFLDQPLVVYGHHDDVADGLDVLEGTRRRIDALGNVRWCSPQDIAGSNYMTRLEGGLMVVRLLSRRAVVQVPPSVQTIRVETPAADVDPAQVVVRCEGMALPLEAAGAAWTCEPIAVEGNHPLSIELSARQSPDSYSAAPRRPAAWPIARRALAQGRDRILPVISRYRRA